MIRQCAWCLCVIDIFGQRLSASPVPKIYEASHGMCKECGQRWLEEVMNAVGVSLASTLANRTFAVGDGHITQETFC